MERPDEVLGRPEVDAGLAADAAVHLGQQRGRDLHEVQAPRVRGGGEAGHVAQDAAAQGDDDRAPVGGVVVERLIEALHGRQRFPLFAVRDGQNVNLKAGVCQALRHALAIAAVNAVVAEDHGLPPFGLAAGHAGGDFRADLRQQAAPDEDVIGAVGKADVNGLGGLAHSWAWLGDSRASTRPAASSALAQSDVSSW